MKLDAAWHEWVLVALAVVVDGVLAVSAQCGCCHHFLQYFTDMLFQVCCALVSFFSSFGLLPFFCYMYSSFVESILHIILHGLLFVFFVLVLFHFTWCIYYGDYGLCFGGGSYSAVYVPPPLYIFPVVLVVYIPSFFFCYVFCTYSLIHICP